MVYFWHGSYDIHMQFFQFTEASIHLWADLGEGLEAHPVIGGKHSKKHHEHEWTCGKKNS